MAEKTDRSQIITLSIPKIQDDFIKEHKIKPSKILQEAIADLMKDSVELVGLRNQLQSMKKLYARDFTYFADYLAYKNIDYSEFVRWKEEQVKHGSHQLV